MYNSNSTSNRAFRNTSITFGAIVLAVIIGLGFDSFLPIFIAVIGCSLWFGRIIFNNYISELSDIIENTPTDKIRRLEKHIAVLEAELVTARAADVQNLLGPLRLRQTVLIYFGKKQATDFAAELEDKFGRTVADAIGRHLFTLNNAPIDKDQREAMLKAFDYGNCRW